MKSRNKEVRKAIEESAPTFKAVRRATFPLAIRSVMQRKGLVNRDIAERLSVSEKKVTLWLLGDKPLSLKTMYRLADAVEEPLNLFLGDSSEQL